MKKFLILLILIFSSINGFAKDVSLYFEADDNICLDKDIKEIFKEAFDYEKEYLKQKDINLEYEGYRPNLYQLWSNELNPEVKIPHININCEENEYKELNLNIEVYRSENSNSSYSSIFYIEKLNRQEKVNLFKKFIEGAASTLTPEEEKNQIELSLIDSFDLDKYYPSDSSSALNVRCCAGDNYKIYKNSSGNVYSFSPFWNREISFSEKLGEKNILESYSPLYIDNDMVKLVSPYNTKTYIFDKTGKLLRTESLVIPDSKIYFIGFTDTGLPLYYDFGKNYFNAKLIKAGYEGQALKEYTFVQGLQGSRKTGNNGDYWIERYEATCVYNNDGELVKVIFKSGESDSDHHIAFVDKENNFLTYNMYGNTIVKYNYDGKKIWSADLPEVCKNTYLFGYRDGILYFQDSKGTVIRVKDPEAKLPAELEKLVQLNQTLKDVNSRSKNAECYKQIADIYLVNNGISAAYEYLKKYLEYSPADSKAREQMLNCELALAKESAAEHAAKAIELYEEYGEETADEEYKAAMKILEKYRKYFPQDEELLGIYNDLKKSLGSDVVAKPVPSLEVMSVELGVLFPALMNVYACEPSGVLKVKNNSKETIKNVELSAYIRKYMDFGSASDIVAEIKPGDTVEIPIKTVLNSEVMKVNENVNLQMQLTLTWNEKNLQKKQVITRPVTMYKKSAIVWSDTSMLSCFILPNDKSVASFAFNTIVINERKVLSHNISNGILICNAVGKLPVKYIPDPIAPVSEQLGNEYAVDTVRLPFETLKLKGGDCDDLTTLLCSLMESAGISTALITTSGHIFMAFNTGKAYNSVWNNLPDGYAALEVDGEAWIPVEVTACNNGFMKAWKTACDTLMNEDFEFIPVSDAMLRYQSVSVEESEEKLLNGNISVEEKMLNENCFNEITALFVKASPVSEEECNDADELNGIAEIYFELNDIENSIRTLLKAYKIDSRNKAVVSNLSGLFKLKGDEINSGKYSKIAESLSGTEKSGKNNDSRKGRGDDKNSIAMERLSRTGDGVRIRGKNGVLKRARPVSSSIGGATVTQKSVQTASSRADEKNTFEWKK